MAKREMKTVKTEDVKNDELQITHSEVEETVEEAAPKTLVGIVIDCSKLNVRKKANIKADVVSVINAKTEVAVYPDDSTKEWYKVTVNGVDGFCMKKFISIKG